MSYPDFLKITNRVFNDADNVVIIFLNELEKKQRESIYNQLFHINDATIDSYHTLIKLILEKSEENNEEFASEVEQFFEVKRLISEYQEILQNLLLLFKTISASDLNTIMFEFDVDLNATCKELSFYTLN